MIKMRHPVDYKNFEEDIHWGFSFLEYDNNSNAHHPGVDYNLHGSCDDDLGESVFPVTHGTVIKVNQSDAGFGNQVIIDHGDFYARYAHLDKTKVQKDEDVNPVEAIGTIGNTGTYCSHLHFEMWEEEMMQIMKKENGSHWFNYYPAGEDKQWVKNKYLNPIERLGPMEASLMLVMDGSEAEFWKDMQFKVDQLTNWFNHNSGHQIELNVDWEWIELDGGYEDKYKDKYINQKWFRLNVLPYASGYDMCAFVQKEDEFKSEGIWGVAFGGSDLGVETMHQMGTNKEREYNGSWADNGQFLGTLRHEICHTLFDITGDDIESGKNFVHKYDYDSSTDISEVFKHIDFRNFYGWDLENKTRVFKYENQATTRTEKLTFEPEDGKYYHDKTGRAFTMYDSGIWRKVSPSRFKDVEAQQKPIGIISPAELNYIFKEKMNLDIPDPTQGLGIKMLIESSPMRIAYLRRHPKFYVGEIPKEHLNNA